jgi:GNAT superfamily N-acetyltransferase
VTAAAPPRPEHVAASVRVLEWDTNFFGARMGAIELSERAPIEGLAAQLQETIDRAIREKFDHLILRCDAADWAAAWAAEQARMRLVDVGIDLRCPDVTDLIPSPRCRPWVEDDLPGLRELAAGSFVFSRFAADPFFSADQVRAFHAEWVTNLCRGLADAVLVVGEPGSPMGFVSCTARNGIARIPLIAVRADARRQGVGDALIAAAKAWFASTGLDCAWVKTQVQNYPALALYARHGFVPARSEFVFSITLPTGSDMGGSA